MNIIRENKQFLLFVLTGGFSAIINIISRIILSIFFEFQVSIFFAYLFGMITAYLLAKKYVFLNPISSNKKSFLAFIFVNILAILQTYFVSNFFRQFLGSFILSNNLNDFISHCIGVAIPIFSSFYGHKYISFRNPRK